MRTTRNALGSNPLQTSLLAGFDEPAALFGATATVDDAKRLTGQRAQILALMSDGNWHTLPGLVKELRRNCGRLYAETSVSARLRELRDKGFEVQRERTRPGSGLYQYRAVKVETEAAA